MKRVHVDDRWKILMALQDYAAIIGIQECVHERKFLHYNAFIGNLQHCTLDVRNREATAIFHFLIHETLGQCPICPVFCSCQIMMRPSMHIHFTFEQRSSFAIYRNDMIEIDLLLDSLRTP